MLTALVLRSRCAFSKFCASSIKIPRSTTSSAPTLFPIALPCDCPFDRMDSKLSFRKRARIHEQRALHIMVLALNYWHYGGSFVPLEQLGRKPSSLHIHVFSTLKRFLRSEVPAKPFAIVKAGRRFPQLQGFLNSVNLPPTLDLAANHTLVLTKVVKSLLTIVLVLTLNHIPP